MSARALSTVFLRRPSPSVYSRFLPRRYLSGDAAHASPPIPPFARNLAPSSRLHEEHELVWDDGVAPELTIDFDASHIGKWEGLAWWLGGFGFFGLVFAFASWTDPASKNPAVNREAMMIPDKPRAAAAEEEE